MKQIIQRENNLHIINDNKFKFQNKREKSNSRTKNNNKTFQKSKINQEVSFNDITANIPQKKLSKIYSFSKRDSNKKDHNNEKPKIKKGKSSICLKVPNKNSSNNTINQVRIITNSNSKSTSVNKKSVNKNSNNMKNVKKNNNSINIDNNNIEKSNNNSTNTTNGKNNNFSFNPKFVPANTGEKSQNVKVFIRFRPSNELETSLLQNNYGWLVPKFITEKQLPQTSKQGPHFLLNNTSI
jgi:hypothetical protein